jgi:hypothetical protein
LNLSLSLFPRQRNKSLGETGIKVDNDQRMEIDPPPTPFCENVATADDWMKALNKVVPAVVVLNTMACCDTIFFFIYYWVSSSCSSMFKKKKKKKKTEKWSF